MTEVSIIDCKLECLRLAITSGAYSIDDGVTEIKASKSDDEIVKMAQKFYDFVIKNNQ